MLEELRDKKIVILGHGREGKDTLLFLSKLFPKKKIGLADQKFGKDYLQKLKNYEIIIKSPGVPFKIIPRLDLGKITTQTEIFFENCPGTIVGITGTKGKSTTASLIYEILKAGGLKAHLVGNIGKPVLLSLLKAQKDDIFVYELSSFQLTNLKNSPHIAVLLNIYPEHLDYYRSFKEYVSAKANITFHQTKDDYLVYNFQNKIVSKIAKKSLAQKILIKGAYYDLDRNAARAVGEIFKIKKSIVEKNIGNFKPLEHRLELVGTFKGITFYNDSLATIPEAAIAAIDNLGDKVETMILGGFDRGLDFKKLAGRIAKSQIKTLLLFPTSGQRIWQAMLGLQNPTMARRFFVKDMERAVKLVYKYTGKGKICLMSPASPSFGVFKDYADRGGAFKKYVRKYGKIK